MTSLPLGDERGRLPILPQDELNVVPVCLFPLFERMLLTLLISLGTQRLIPPASLLSQSVH